MAKRKPSKKSDKETPWWKVTPAELLVLAILGPLRILIFLLFAPGLLITRIILRLPPDSDKEGKIVIVAGVVFYSVVFPLLLYIFNFLH